MVEEVVMQFYRFSTSSEIQERGKWTSKNKMRGADKVIQVLLGTMIHLVEREATSLVDDCPLKALDPWELPDALEGNHSHCLHKTKLVQDTSKAVSQSEDGEIKDENIDFADGVSSVDWNEDEEEEEHE
ncbi:hypothetical protein FRX31_021421, partial [Thalictrum thalictroides]